MNKHPMPGPAWRLINWNCRLSGPPGTMLHVPFRIYSDFDVRYVLFDENGNVKHGARTFLEAMRLRRRTGLRLTRMLD